MRLLIDWEKEQGDTLRCGVRHRHGGDMDDDGRCWDVEIPDRHGVYKLRSAMRKSIMIAEATATTRRALRGGRGRRGTRKGRRIMIDVTPGKRETRRAKPFVSDAQRSSSNPSSEIPLRCCWYLPTGLSKSNSSSSSLLKATPSWSSTASSSCRVCADNRASGTTDSP